MIAFVLGLTLGVGLAVMGSYAWVFSRYRHLSEQPCTACGRPSAIVATVIDLETHKPRAISILCDPCANHAKAAVAESPAPWAKYWR